MPRILDRMVVPSLLPRASEPLRTVMVLEGLSCRGFYLGFRGELFVSDEQRRRDVKERGDGSSPRRSGEMDLSYGTPVAPAATGARGPLQAASGGRARP